LLSSASCPVSLLLLWPSLVAQHMFKPVSILYSKCQLHTGFNMRHLLRSCTPTRFGHSRSYSYCLLMLFRALRTENFHHHHHHHHHHERSQSLDLKTCSPHLMEPEGSLSCSQKHATDPYPETHESSSHLPSFSSPPRPDRLWGPPSLISMGTRGSFPGSKAAGAWSYTSTSQYAFMAWCSVKAQG